MKNDTKTPKSDTPETDFCRNSIARSVAKTGLGVCHLIAALEFCESIERESIATRKVADMLANELEECRSLLFVLRAKGKEADCGCDCAKDALDAYAALTKPDAGEGRP